MSAAQMQNETILMNRCKLVEDAVSGIHDRYKDIPGFALSADLGRLKRRALEYKHGTFIILVVGPAKSGKSTLVNLIAGNYVSPTSFLECTVRPSVISRQEKDKTPSLTVYSSTDVSGRVDQINSIVDTIRGFGSESDLDGIVCKELPLTEENIRKYVQLGLEHSLDSENLMTSIRTSGGRLLQDRVFLIDMPGLDGGYQNVGNPVYEAIAQRADLIIFVQSSNSAFSKVSKEFLDILAKNNKSVPVALVHNVFDAAWWRDDREKKKAIEDQKDFACAEIRRHGFFVGDDLCFDINLGAVEDDRKGLTDDKGILPEESDRFAGMETKMYNRIIGNRDSMRLATGLKRVAQHRDRILEKAREESGRLGSLLSRYEEVKNALNDLGANLIIGKTDILAPDRDTLASAILTVYNSWIKSINNCPTGNNAIRKSNSEAREYVESFVTKINGNLDSEIPAIFRLSDIASAQFELYRDALSGLEEKIIKNPLFSEGASRSAFLGRIPLEITEKFDLMPKVNISTIVPVHTRMGLSSLGRSHTAEELISYISVVKDVLIPFPDPVTGLDESEIVRTDLPRIKESIGNALGKLTDSYNEDIRKYYDKICSDVLGGIIADPAAVEKQKADYDSFIKDLESIKIGG